jgi:YhcH/YjgK/YiaL family protein
MIIDRIENAHKYYGIGSRFASALNYLLTEDLLSVETVSLEDGKVTISVGAYVSKPEADCNTEAHATVADIHYCLKGTEVIGYCDRSYATPKSGSDLSAETVYFDQPELNYFKLLPGMFCIMLPEDVHRAKIMNGVPEDCRKAIVKVSLV